MTPVQYIFTGVDRMIDRIWHRYILLVRTERENERLRRKNSELEGSLVQCEEVRQENGRLHELLSYREGVPQATIMARVIANDPRAEFKSLVLDRGRADGVDIHMPVMGNKGIIGRVGKVSSHEALVLLITDPNSAVDVFVQRSRARGLLVGTQRGTELRPGYYLARLEYLRRVSDIQNDDIVVTSGFDRVFPAGLPVGSITNVSSSKYGVFQDADVVPFENFAEVQEVMVILAKPDLFNASGE